MAQLATPSEATRPLPPFRRARKGSSVDKHDPKIVAFTRAAAKAEGFGPAKNLPTRINNPCDLELGDRGCGVEAGKTKYGSVADGWEAGFHEFWLIFSNASPVYEKFAQTLALEHATDLTILELATKYTGADNAAGWARIVAGQLGLTSLNTLADWLAAPAKEPSA